MVAARIRALERKLTKERATLAVRDFAERVSAHWRRIVERPGDPNAVALDVIREHWDWSIGVPTLTRAHSLIRSHLRDGTRPTERTIVTTMAPWSVSKLNHSK